MIVVFLFAMMLGIMLMRVYLPYGQRAQGRDRRTTTLDFHERLLLQRKNVYAIGVVLLITALGGLSSPLIQAVVVMAVLAILCIPVRYRLTDDGIGLNNVVFRRWEEFQGLVAGPRSYVLLGDNGAANFTIQASPRRHPDIAAAIHDALGRRGRSTRQRAGRRSR
jgi:Amt family ammonium transporter